MTAISSITREEAREIRSTSLRTTAPELSLVIPAYNERTRLSRTFPQILAYLEMLGVSYEIIVVDDGSADGTAEAVRAMSDGGEGVRIIRHERNAGKGRAVRTGMLAAKGDYVVFTDADLSVPIETLGPFLARLADGSDVVIGNRRMKESRLEVRQPQMREFLGRIFTRLTRFILRSDVTDQTCGFKGFTRRAAGEVFPRQRMDDWAFDAEILHIAHRRGLKIDQVPVTWRDDAASKVKVVRACAKSLKSLAAIRLNGLLGRYR